MTKLLILILLIAGTAATPTSADNIARPFFPGFQTLPPTPPRNMDPVIYAVLERKSLRGKS